MIHLRAARQCQILPHPVLEECFKLSVQRLFHYACVYWYFYCWKYMVLIIVENVYMFKAQFKFAKRYFMCTSKTPDKKKDIFANSLKRKMWFLYNSMGEGEAWTIQNIVLMNAVTESRMKTKWNQHWTVYNILGRSWNVLWTILTTLKPYMSFLKTLWQCHFVGGGHFISNLWC